MSSFPAVERTQKAPDTSASAQLRSGVLWIAGLNVFRDFLQFGVMLILVRILDPSAYGQFGLVTSIMGFFTVISYQCFIEQTLQARPHEEVDYQSHFSAAAIPQGMVFLLVNILAFSLRYFPAYSEVAPLLHAMSLLFLLAWPSELRTKMLERNLRWRRLRLLQAIGVGTTAFLSVALALAGFGTYSLLLPGLVATLPFCYDLFVTEGWKPSWQFNGRNLSSARRYGFTRIGSGLLITSRGLAESAFLVQLIGFSAFGILGRATALAAIFCLKLPSLFTQTLYPLLAQIEAASESYARASSLILRAVAWLAVPAAVLCGILSEPLVLRLYGSQWVGVVELVPWAAAAAAVAVLVQTGTILLLGNLGQRTCLLADGITLIATVGALAFLAPLDVRFYLAGVILAHILALTLLISRLHQTGVLTLRDIALAFGVPLASAATGYLSARILSSVVQLSPVPFGAAYALFTLFAFRLSSPDGLAELLRRSPAPHIFLMLFRLSRNGPARRYAV